LEMLADGADEVIVACDYDIEGSLIGYNALRYACRKKDGKRMKFSALTKGDLEDAYEARSDLDLPNAQAGDARHKLDWYYGINLSRALMSAIRAAGKFQIMSIGRVQGPALKLLADREKAIAAFVPVPYWELACAIDAVKFKHEKDRFDKKEEAVAAMAASEKGPHAIEKIEKKPFEQAPNPPFDLTSLQVEAYRQFKYAPTATLQMAQALYEASMISYPRTSSQKLPEKLNLAKIIAQLGHQAEYAPLCQRLISEKRFKPLEGKKEDPAHPAIHPTGQGGSVGERERKLYDLIVKRFLSCFAPNAVRESQKVVAKCGCEKYNTTGSRTASPGWFEFYKPYVKLEEVTLPAWQAGQAVNAGSFAVDEKKTQPPKRFTPASVISELEDHDLGTKATRAVVVDTLFKRGYLSGKTSIAVTAFGLKVAETMGKYAPEIMDEELTRGIEKEMEAIQEKHIHPDTVIEDGKKILIKTLEQFRSREHDVGMDLSAALSGARAEANKLGPCPKCGKDLRKIQSRFGKQFVGCSGYPECKQTYSLPQMALIEPLGTLCEKCHTPQIKVIRKGQHPFTMCLEMSCETKNDPSLNRGSVRLESEVKASAPAAAKPALLPTGGPAAYAPIEKKTPSAPAAGA
ncbi:MAG: DNA topoisomerase I, partial [Candidatus Micrarchaeota archaeon]|nr:DNA topoisomerase I [Candidatus Micrarchaeota archaeon]